jgi:hypothetical protein
MPLANHAADLVGIEEAIRFAGSVQETEIQENSNDKFYKRKVNRTYNDRDIARHAVETRTANQAGHRRKKIPQNASRARVARNRNAQTEAALRRNEREGKGYFARKCSVREQGNSQW